MYAECIAFAPYADFVAEAKGLLLDGARRQRLCEAAQRLARERQHAYPQRLHDAIAQLPRLPGSDPVECAGADEGAWTAWRQGRPPPRMDFAAVLHIVRSWQQAADTSA